MYFGEVEEQAIANYVKINKENIEERNKIFEKLLYEPFKIMAESIINTYRYYNTGLEPQELVNECLTHIYFNIDKFDPIRGTKAYSYFGTIIKRYCIQLTMSNTKQKMYSTIQGVDDEILKNQEIEIIFENHYSDRRQEIKDILLDFNNYIEERKTDISCGDPIKEKVLYAILFLLNNVDDISILKKKSVYILIREVSGATTPHITDVVKKMKILYKEFLKDYYSEGKE